MGIKLNKIKNYTIFSSNGNQQPTQFYLSVQNVFEVNIPASQHHFTRLPIVTILDQSNQTINANIIINPSNYHVQILFNQAFSGKIYLN